VTLPLPTGEFRAFLFDCDGTIADSMPLHHQAWQQALAEWNCDLPEDLFYAWGGRPTADVIADLNTRYHLRMPVAEVDARREHLFQQLLPTVQAVPGVLAHITAAYGKLPLAVVSGSSRPSVTASLTALHLLDRFDVMVCAGNYTKGKPDPEPYLTAAALLNIPAGSCLVFEDTDLGVQSATAAGMQSVRVPSPLERRKGATQSRMTPS
jgi:HAD superfamily hydrolase (TIGR01509 family)